MCLYQPNGYGLPVLGYVLEYWVNRTYTLLRKTNIVKNNSSMMMNLSQRENTGHHRHECMEFNLVWVVRATFPEDMTFLPRIKRVIRKSSPGNGDSIPNRGISLSRGFWILRVVYVSGTRWDDVSWDLSDSMHNCMKIKQRTFWNWRLSFQ